MAESKEELKSLLMSVKPGWLFSIEAYNFCSAAKVTVDPPLRPIRSTALVKPVSILSVSN